MPRKARELTALDVKRLAHPGHDRNATFAVGGIDGLLLQITPTGGRSWLLRCIVGAKRRHIGLGGYPDVTLAGARERAREARDLIRQGVDPVEQRKAHKAALVASQRRGILFKDAVDKFEPVKRAELSDGKYRDQWRDSLDKYAIPELGAMRVQDITLQDVLRVLSPMWEGKTITADKLRRKIREVLDYAAVMGFRTGDNPARWEGNLSMVLSAPGKAANSENYPALQLKDAANWWADLQAREGISAAALRWQALTATRSGAVRFATWDEIDLTGRVWTVQPGRQSSKIPARDTARRVPLTDAMLALLKGLPRRDDSPYLFSAVRGGPLSDATLGAVMAKMHAARKKLDDVGYVDAKTGEPAVPHGVRSTFKDWATDRTGYEWELSEAALWHKIGGKAEQAYARSDMLERRRAMMAAWGRFLRGEAGENVIELHRGA